MFSENPRLRVISGRALHLITVAIALGVGAIAAPVDAAPTGEVKIALAAEPNTFDPHLTVGRNSQIFIVNVFDGLTARDASANILPALATEWGYLGDGS